MAKRGKKAEYERPYASPAAPAWSVDGLNVSQDSEVFKTKNPETGEKTELTADVRSVEFGSLATASAFLGDVDAMLAELEYSVNSWLKSQARSAAILNAFGLERKIRAEYENVVLPAFVAKRGTQPTAEQVAKLMDVARKRVSVELDDNI